MQSTGYLERWMSSLPPHLSALPIFKLKIPGSHDSGSTIDLNVTLPVANDKPFIFRQLGRPKWVKNGIKRWAVTQSSEIIEQLRLGVRYLDLRISYPPSKLRTSNTDFRVVHGLYGAHLNELLADVNSFLEENPKEVVLLDINHLYGFNQESFNVLRHEIVNILRQAQLCPFTTAIEKVTLDYVWSNGYRVIILSPSKKERPNSLFWSSKFIESPWPKTTNMALLLRKLEKDLETRSTIRESKPPHTFFVTQGVLTPHTHDVLLRWCSSLRNSFSLRATTRVLDWLGNLKPEYQKKVNVVILDFVSKKSSEKIISLNFGEKSTTVSSAASSSNATTKSLST
ncbi:hypothetical protein Q1695_004950 [Nippostrongylus brasiliensis]|nr:hypothetical protein Q1695_004950 [Nippostrongylus brasiliensis]